MDLLTLGATLKIGASLFKGYSEYNAAQNKADEILFDGRLAYQESLRNAAIIEEEGTKFAEKQSNQYIASGVELGGSALITLAQTKSYAKAEANAVRTRGVREQTRAEKEAKTMRRMGNASIISSLFNTGADVVGLFNQEKEGTNGSDNTVSTK